MSKSNTTVADAYNAWMLDAPRRKNSSTVNTYKSATERFADVHADKPIGSVDEDDIEDHLDWLVSLDLAKSSVATRYQAFKAFWSWLYQRKRWIDHNPTGRVSVYDRDGFSTNYTKKGEVTRAKNGIVYATPEEVEQIAANVRPPRIRNELMVKFAFQTGVRAVELCDIRVRDIDPDPDRDDPRQVRIKTAKREKEEYRLVWFGESLDLLMRQWRRDREAMLQGHCPYLFLTNRSSAEGDDGSTQMTPKTFADIVKDGAERAGIQDVLYTREVEVERKGEKRTEQHNHYRLTPHALRHGFAVACIRGNGVNGSYDGSSIDLRSLQMAMGHSRIEVTAKYLDLDEDTLRSKFQRHAPR